ncbi:MAG: polyprenyl synthetase family protein [Flavobacteriales bacterium]
MNTVQEIKAPIREELNTFESHFRESMKSDVPLLNKITHYIVKRKGKQMRPMFVFLSGKVFGAVRDESYTAASLIELLHTATLVHDDVVDDANERRGYFSLNALWKNKIAVLVGDYLLSRGLLTSVENDQQELLRIVSRAVERMSEGELLQMEKARLLNLNEETYYRVIGHKTASLISACCEAGAYSTGASDEERQKMRSFGESVGMAFQIKDDLFDYGDGMDTGKATGVDIQERKLTLPLIHTLAHSDKKTQRRLSRIIKKRNKDRKTVEEVIDTVRSNGGLDYAREQMEAFKHQALEELYSLPDNEARKALEGLVTYTTERSK